MSLATQIALTAHEQALKAAELEALHEQALKMDALRQQSKRHEETFQAALPILGEWFPGVEWQYSSNGDYGHDTIIQERGASWYAPLKLKATRYVIDMNEVEAGYRVELKIGDYAQDTSMPGHTYFQGNVVKSAADVGRYLAARQA